MYILPTRGRPHLIPRFFASAPPVTKGVLALDEDDAHNYAGVQLPSNWTVRITPRAYCTDKLNEAFKAFPDEPFYGFVMDDTVPLTPRWDVLLAKKAGAWGIAWPDDCLPGKRPSAIVLGGDLVRALGWIAEPTIKHFYADNVWEAMAADLKCAGRCEEIKVAHLHFSNGSAPFDKTYEERPDRAKDAASFRKWMLVWPELKRRIESLNHPLIQEAVNG